MPTNALAATEREVRALKQTVSDLKKQLELMESRLETIDSEVEQNKQAVEATADAVESAASGPSVMDRISIGGYGELHYNNLDADDSSNDLDRIDLHRFVLFGGQAALVTPIVPLPASV